TKVEAGTVLAQLDDSVNRARVDRAKAEADAAKAKVQLEKAELAYAEAEHDRGRKLLATGGITREEADSLTRKCDVAKARVLVAEAGAAAADAALKEATIKLGYATIRSPIAGVIIDRRVNVGQAVNPGLSEPALFLIARDLKRLKVWVSVNEADVGLVRKGQRATFTTEAHPGAGFAGKVSQVRLNATLTQNVVTYTVVVDAENPDEKLIPYLTADVKIVAAEGKGVLLVPEAALRWRPRADQVAADYRKEFEAAPRPDDGEDRLTATVWVEDKGDVRPVKLRLGVSDGNVTEVVKGDLKEGTSVVTGEVKSGLRKNESGEGRGSRPAPGGDVLRVAPEVFSRVSPPSLSAEDAEAIGKRCPAVAEVAPIVRARTQVVHGKRNWVPLYLYGSTPGFLALSDREVAEGRAFTSDEVRSRRRVCLLGRSVVKELFGGNSPLGKDVSIAGTPFEVVGVLAPAGLNVMGVDQDDVVLAPDTSLTDQVSKASPPAEETTAIGAGSALYPNRASEGRRGKGPVAVDAILVRASSAREVEEAENQITALLREQHRIRKLQPDDFTIRGEMSFRGGSENRR
ncbi:MAG TPA: efflux RND transporter periplasmic adaptor subunit, partial [Gemmataceae bacterium]|nr:efflux RND transporter periplasmic adaptor subunit [Gemmataceae bacterium]